MNKNKKNNNSTRGFVKSNKPRGATLDNLIPEAQVAID